MIYLSIRYLHLCRIGNRAICDSIASTTQMRTYVSQCLLEIGPQVVIPGDHNHWQNGEEDNIERRMKDNSVQVWIINEKVCHVKDEDYAHYNKDKGKESDGVWRIPKIKPKVEKVI